MSAVHTSEAPARSADTRHLYRIINTVSSTLDLDRVLRAIVDLVSDAVDGHACFVYFVEPDGSLVLRAVSDPYTALVGRLRFEPGEGLAGWVAQHDEPVFLADGALTDPRVKVVPEADEDRYQSLVAVPLRGKGGEVIGVISLHAEAPREFTQDDSDFMVHAASLVAGAIENARLYESTRRRLALVEGLADLARAVSAASTLEQLLPAVVRRAQRLLHAEACEVFVVAGADGRFRRGAAWPESANGDRDLSAAEVGVELARAAADGGDGRRLAELLWGDAASAGALVVPLVAADELVGVLALRIPASRPIDAEERDIAASIAAQTAVGIKTVRMIERLTEHNAIKDFLEDLSAGRLPAQDLRERGRALGCDVDRPQAIGLSHRCEGAAGSRTGFEEAEHAVTAAAVVSATPGVVSFDDLGAYKYLLRVSQDGRARDPRGEALKTLEEYDARHRSQLLLTLEEYLKRRGNIAQAAQTLYVHPNTLRQRLRRIHDLTGLDVQHEDWLMIEIELKLLRLEHALGQR